MDIKPRKRKRTPTTTDSAKKREKVEYMRDYRAKRKDCVYLCGEITRWNYFKTNYNCDNDEEAARMLLDFVDRHFQPQTQASTSSPSVRFSTPRPTHKHSSRALTYFQQSASEVSSISSGDGKNVVSEVSDEAQPLAQSQPLPALPAFNVSYNAHDATQEQFNLNVTVERFSDGAELPVEKMYTQSDTGLTFEDDPYDLTFVPDTVKVNYRDSNINYDNLEVIGDDDDDGDINEMPEDTDQELETDTSESSDYDDVLKDHLSIAFDSKLLELASLSVYKCRTCDLDMLPSIFHTGSSTQIKWSCSSGHKGRTWSSQPTLKKIRAGDFLLATNILLSGNNYNKISLFFKFMKLGCVSRSTFFRIQSTYCVPVIKKHWETMTTGILNTIRGKELVLLGDGQNDSPGHCAQYLNYNIIDNDTGLLIHVNTIDKRQTGGNSTNMEIEGFKKALSSLKDDGQTIREVVTDAHVQIKSYMAKQEPTIKHSNDIWHGAKSISKKISKATQKSENRTLAVWTNHTINHFWYCAKNCDGSAEKFFAIWRGHLQHVVNNHQWVSGDGFIEPKCNHGDLIEHEDIWLKPGSAPHRALEKIVLDNRLVKSLPYFVNFRHTGNIESFHAFKLLYASKRQSYSPPVYNARCLLAAIDFNSHANREPLRGADGNIRYNKKYSKRSKTWTAVPVMPQKKYTYIPDLIKEIVVSHTQSVVAIPAPISMELDDPRKIRRTLASTDAPALADIVKQKTTRF